jgi:hypothetical protein
VTYWGYAADTGEVTVKPLDDIRAKMAESAKLERLLTKTIDRYEGGKAPDRSVLDILASYCWSWRSRSPR